MNPILKLQEDALILDQQQVAMQTYRMRLRSPEIAAGACPGQFVMLQVREGMDPLLRRPLSFHRIMADRGTVEILYRVMGRGTLWLSRCVPGTRLSLLGPLGNGFKPPRDQDGSVALVAGGIGIAPLYELLLRLVSGRSAADPATIHLFYGARTAAELLPAEIFPDLGISIHWSTDDGSRGYHGFVPQLLRQVVEKERLRLDLLYACGPLAMQYHVAQWAAALSIPSQLSLESLMACGVGACLGCALPAFHPTDPTADHYVHVCKDGPIFSAGSIQWQKLQLHQAAPPIFLYS